MSALSMPTSNGPTNECETLATALRLLGMGLWPVAITSLEDASTVNPGKAPVGMAWGKSRPTEDSLRTTWSSYQHGSPGVGLKLGPMGGIIDIEIDEREIGEDTLLDLLDGEDVPTLGWESTRGMHRLFHFDARLAKYRKNIVKIGGVEIRVNAQDKQLQSVVPPSPTSNGQPRTWNGCWTISELPEIFYDKLDAKLIEAGIIQVPTPSTLPMRPAPSLPLSTSWTPELRAIAYLSKVDPAISGQAGHSQAFKAACKIGPGFDLHPDACLQLITSHFNPRCQPPWSDKELLHKVQEAYKVETRRGWLLETTRDVPPQRPGGDGASLGGGNGDEGNDAGDQPPDDDDRPTIVISTDEHIAIEQATAALASAPDLYSRGPILVDVFGTDDAGARIWVTPYARLRTTLTRHARICQWGKDHPKPIHPPDWLVRGILDRGTWPELRPLETVIESPVLRPDGTILDRPGYDRATRLLYLPNGTFPAIDPKPTETNAKAAASRLMDLVSDFPFMSPAHQAAWLASCLTPFARPAIEGPTPLFLFVANCPGTGKTKLCDLVSILVSGRDIPRTVYPERDEEMRKRILAILMSGDRLQMIDNIATRFGGAALDSVLTSTTVKDRVLGKSEMSAELPNVTTWYATGNNVEIFGDLMRRVITSRLVSATERPELRSDFKYPDLLKHVRENRGQLVRDCLTILVAYSLAGRPDRRQPLGSYESWSDVVRSAVFWSTGRDPCDATEELRQSDSETLSRLAVIKGWSELPDADRGLTVAQAIKMIRGSPDDYTTLRDALMEWSRSDDLPSVKQVGKRLGMLRDRVVEGLRLSSFPVNGSQVWKVVRDQGFEGFRAVDCSPLTCEESETSSRNRAAVNTPKPLKPLKEETDQTKSEDREELDL